MLRSGLITPYRGERYHIKEYSQRNPPRNAFHNFLMGVDPDEGLIAEVDVEIAREPIEHTNHALNLDNHEDARK
ncbi:hypothetical protein Patl1_27759 [Pistacia atlantica]|uniref:Uncharacterized protein n=1 Tax=Pistacia atlantica TaxID=434234 RepID=A0ACC1BGG8_9ROSI|nr:hypothetical protein Patl1_27759 [Pistacia atlantica]